MPSNEINNAYIDQIRKSLAQNTNSLQAVDDHLIELAKMLIPLFPQSSSVDRNSNPIDDLYEEGIICLMLNVNLSNIITKCIKNS
jgi:hypothetical protein